MSGTIRCPGDKSISHRALIFSALGSGRSRVRGVLQSEDVQATASALRRLGAPLPPLSDDFSIDGVGVGELRSPSGTLDCGNSGTTTRLLAGVVAGLDGRSARFDGDASLRGRPMGRIAAPLTSMGARFEFGDVAGVAAPQRLPMHVHGAGLRSIVWHSEHASAQIKGAVLLAALVSGTEVEIHEPSRSRDHTERLLAVRGVSLQVRENRVHLAGAQSLRALDVNVPADPSSAAFFAALAVMADEGEVRLTDVCLNPTRTGAFEVLHRMGASVRFAEQREDGGETVGTVVAAASTLRGTRIGGAEIPRCIDELPLLACVAARAEGETIITDARELRVK
ncbi:MAG: 3-phosphoshikimate 1-carboxyvinyltransferase, partial [Gemmatimonas sp.]